MGAMLPFSAMLAVADRGSAGQRGENMVRGTVMAAASRRQAQGLIAGNVVAAEVVDGTFRVDRQVLGRARQLGREPDTASPSLVLAQSQLGHLAQLRAFPLHRELHGCFVQIRRALPGSVNCRAGRCR